MTETFTLWPRHHSSSARRLRVLWTVALVAGGACGCSRLAGAEQWRSAWATSTRLGGPLWLLLALPAVGARSSALLAGLAAHYLGKLWLAVELGLGLYFLGLPLTTCAPLSLAWLCASAAGSVVPGQLGVVEAALLHAGGALGIAAPGLQALALMRRLRAVVWLILGLLLAARIVSRSPAEVTHVSTAIA